MVWVVNAVPRSLYPRERDQLAIVQEAGWVPGQFWTGSKIFAPPQTVQPVASRCTYYAIPG